MSQYIIETDSVRYQHFKRDLPNIWKAVDTIAADIGARVRGTVDIEMKLVRMVLEIEQTLATLNGKLMRDVLLADTDWSKLEAGPYSDAFEAFCIGEFNDQRAIVAALGGPGETAWAFLAQVHDGNLHKVFLLRGGESEPRYRYD